MHYELEIKLHSRHFITSYTTHTKVKLLEPSNEHHLVQSEEEQEREKKPTLESLEWH